MGNLRGDFLCPRIGFHYLLAGVNALGIMKYYGNSPKSSIIHFIGILVLASAPVFGSVYVMRVLWRELKGAAVES
jgi:hypothetical protein